MQYQNINYIITVEITLHKLKYYRQVSHSLNEILMA